jgi:hypothetical protein
MRILINLGIALLGVCVPVESKTQTVQHTAESTDQNMSEVETHSSALHSFTIHIYIHKSTDITSKNALVLWGKETHNKQEGRYVGRRIAGRKTNTSIYPA